MVSYKISPNSITIEQNKGKFNRAFIAYIMNPDNQNSELGRLARDRPLVTTFAESDFMLILQDNKTILTLAINRCDLMRIYLGVKEGTVMGLIDTSTGYRWIWCDGYVDIEIKYEEIDCNLSSIVRKKYQSCIVMLPEQTPTLAVIEQQLFSLSFNHSEIHSLSVT